MMKWNVTVPHLTGGWADHINEYPTENVVARAKALSTQYPDARVTISTCARNRMVFYHGLMVQEEPKLSSYYTGITADQDREWRDLP